MTQNTDKIYSQADFPLTLLRFPGLEAYFSFLLSTKHDFLVEHLLLFSWCIKWKLLSPKYSCCDSDKQPELSQKGVPPHCRISLQAVAPRSHNAQRTDYLKSHNYVTEGECSRSDINTSSRVFSPQHVRISPMSPLLRNKLVHSGAVHFCVGISHGACWAKTSDPKRSWFFSPPVTIAFIWSLAKLKEIRKYAWYIAPWEWSQSCESQVYRRVWTKCAKYRVSVVIILMTNTAVFLMLIW